MCFFLSVLRARLACALFFLRDPATSRSSAMGRRFESAISRRTRKLRRLDHSKCVRKKTVLVPGGPDAFIFFSLRDSATIDVEISREIGRREMGIDPRVNGRIVRREIIITKRSHEYLRSRGDEIAHPLFSGARSLSLTQISAA